MAMYNRSEDDVILCSVCSAVVLGFVQVKANVLETSTPVLPEASGSQDVDALLDRISVITLGAGIGPAEHSAFTRPSEPASLEWTVASPVSCQPRVPRHHV